jgi:hypothetical protein
VKYAILLISLTILTIPAQAQEDVLHNVIQQLEQGTGITPPPAQNMIQAETPPSPPAGIPGIVSMGDNAQLPALPVVPPSYEERPNVILRALDKVTARTETFEIPVGNQFNFGALTIAVRSCRTRPPLEPADNATFLQIVEQKPGEAMIPRFSGWMFSSSPSLSALEHPVYDVWVVGCGEAKQAAESD